MRGRAAPPHPGKTAVEYPPGKRPSWGQKKVATVERLKHLGMNVWTDKCPLWGREVAIVAKKQSVDVRL